MSVGTILRVSPEGKILERRPIWPFPHTGEYPRTLPSGSTLQFFPKPYYHFPLNGILTEVPVFRRKEAR
jgi:hypothetical protein